MAAAPLYLWLALGMERRQWLLLLIVSGGRLLQALLALYFLSGAQIA